MSGLGTKLRQALEETGSLPGSPWAHSRAGGILLLGIICPPVLYLGWQKGGVVPQDQYGAFTWVLAWTCVLGVAGRRLGGCPRIGWSGVALATLPLLQLIPWAGWSEVWPAEHREMMDAVRALGAQPPATISLDRLSTLEGSLVLAGCCALFAMARSMSCRRPRAAWVLAGLIGAGGSAQSLLALKQHLAGEARPTADYPVGQGTFVNPDHLSVLLEAVFAMALGGVVAAWAQRNRHRHWTTDRWTAWTMAAGALAHLALAGVAVSFSRAGFVVVTAQLTAAGLLFGVIRGRPAVTLGALAAGATLWILWLGRLSSRLLSLLEPGGAGRLAIWRDTLGTISNHSLIGAGLGAFRFAFRRSEMYLADKTVDHAHSDYLELIVELGVAGGLALAGGILFVFLRAGVRLWVQARKRGPRSKVCLAAGFWVGAGGLLLHATVDFPLHIPALAALLAVLLGSADGLVSVNRETARAPRLAFAILAGVMAVVGLELARGDFGRWDAEARFAASQKAMVEGDYEEARFFLGKAIDANPYAPTLWIKMAELKELEGDPDRLSYARMAWRLEPHTSRISWPLAQMLLRAGKHEEAEVLLEELEQGMPPLRPAIERVMARVGLEDE